MCKLRSNRLDILLDFIRFRAIAGEFRSDVTQGVAASSGEGSIGFTEMVYATNNNNGIYIVPLVDNFTHGAADAIADGAVAINASVNASRSGEWPLQTDMRAFVSLDQISKNLNFLKFLLSDLGQLKWEQMGFTGLDAWGLYTSWAKLGVDKSYLLQMLILMEFGMAMTFVQKPN